MSADATPVAVTTPNAERKRGYQRWRGERGAQAFRWWVIARGNLSLALANRWVKAILIASLIPGVILAGITYFFLPLSPIALDTVLDAMVLFAFLIAALVGARIISEDRRQGAFLAHFARPVTRVDYMVGKFVALALPMFVVCVASPMFAIAADAAVEDSETARRIQEAGEAFAGDQAYFQSAGYLEIVSAVVMFGLIVAATTSGIVMGLSALTTRARIAGVLWFAVVAFGAAAHGILDGALNEDWPALLSWSDGLTDISSFLLGLTHNPSMGQNLEFDLFARGGLLALAAIVGLVIVHEQLRRAEGGART